VELTWGGGGVKKSIFDKWKMLYLIDHSLEYANIIIIMATLNGMIGFSGKLGDLVLL